jgi:hypothetical protein
MWDRLAEFHFGLYTIHIGQRRKDSNGNGPVAPYPREGCTDGTPMGGFPEQQPFIPLVTASGNV